MNNLSATDWDVDETEVMALAALPHAPLSMPMQRLEYRRGRLLLAVISLLGPRRTTKAGH